MALDKDYEYTKDDLDNHADQMNSNNDTYWNDRGYDERPSNWNN